MWFTSKPLLLIVWQCFKSSKNYLSTCVTLEYMQDFDKPTKCCILCSFIFLILWNHGLYVIFIWKWNSTHAQMSVNGACFHFHWWIASLKPRLIFLPCKLCFLITFLLFSGYSSITNYLLNYGCFLHIKIWHIKCNLGKKVNPKVVSCHVTPHNAPAA